MGLPEELTNVPKLQKSLKVHPEDYWLRRGEDMALQLFADMAQRVPAYKDFLDGYGIDPHQIATIDDFKQLPTINKDNYLKKYDRQQLCWDGDFKHNSWVISMTSGSTGEPFYFPRTDVNDEYYAVTAELYLRENFQIQDKSTLYVDAFALGAWIGGIYTYEAIKRVSQKGYNLSIVTPGINIAEVIRAVQRLGKEFDQVIIGCYPPILKDIIDIGIQRGIKWADYNLGIVFSAEGFSEEFRDYIARFGRLPNRLTSTLNHYGTVDLGTMSHETPASILIRRQAVASKRLFHGLFGDVRKLPTFTQYLPEMFYFEEVDGRVVCSSRSGLPLVRYDLKDNGGVITLRRVAEAYRAERKDLATEISKHGIDQTFWNLPFVYLYERSDFSVVLVGANIFVEEIRKALFIKPLQAHISGKFTMEIVTDRNLDNKLLVNVELKEDIKPSAALKKMIRDAVFNVLIKENSEYAIVHKSLGKRVLPQVKLWAKGHESYFDGKGKQKWVKK